MVAVWALGILVALRTFIALWQTRGGCRRGGSSIAGLSCVCLMFSCGVWHYTNVSLSNLLWIFLGFVARKEVEAPSSR